MYGATALAGGKGGIQCAQHIFEKDDITLFHSYSFKKIF